LNVARYKRYERYELLLYVINVTNVKNVILLCRTEYGMINILPYRTSRTKCGLQTFFKHY